MNQNVKNQSKLHWFECSYKMIGAIFIFLVFFFLQHYVLLKYWIIDGIPSSSNFPWINFKSIYGLTRIVCFHFLFVFIFSSGIEHRQSVKSNMPSGDNHIVVNLIMIELLGTIFFLAIVTICIYIKRLFVRKSLNGFKVLVRWKVSAVIHLHFKNIY